MIIKKYTGKTEAEATEAAKKELGSGLVIMNVREVKKKGFFAFLSPKQRKNLRNRNMEVLRARRMHRRRTEICLSETVQRI